MTTQPSVQTARACQPRLKNISFVQRLKAGVPVVSPGQPGPAPPGGHCPSPFARLLGDEVGYSLSLLRTDSACWCGLGLEPAAGTQPGLGPGRPPSSPLRSPPDLGGRLTQNAGLLFPAPTLVGSPGRPSLAQWGRWRSATSAYSGSLNACTHLPGCGEHGYEVQEPRAEPHCQPQGRQEP